MSRMAPALVGGFVLGGLALVVAAILFFGGRALFSPTDRAVAFFEGSVDGLTVGVPVTFRGVRIGSVSGVSVVIDVRKLQAQIPVYLTIRRDLVRMTDAPDGSRELPPLPEAVEAGLRAKLVMQSLVTRQMEVELDFAPGSPAHLVGGGEADVPEIPTLSSDLAALEQQLLHAPIAETVAQALHTLAAMEKLANKVDTDLDPLLADVTNTLGSARQTMDTARGSIVQVQQDASRLLDAGTALALDGRQQLDARGPELSRALRDADQAVRSANSLVVAVDGMVAPGTRERDDIDATLRDLASSVSSLHNFARTVDRDPSVLLTGRGGR